MKIVNLAATVNQQTMKIIVLIACITAMILGLRRIEYSEGDPLEFADGAIDLAFGALIGLLVLVVLIIENLP